ncbi:MAG: hypothetical protein JST00_32335 [Deltaproteobacteria bacterium]|nr:hypothetical protein [Deltaproteobacteria bacterium]
MSRNPKYPLEPLREHRDRGVDAATAELGEAIRAREAAEAAHRAAEEEKRAAEARAAAVRAEEAERLARGELRAADLAQASAWEIARASEIDGLARQVESAEARAGEARAEETGARSELAQKKADRDVVAKDEARFHDRLRRARDAAEEEAADEAYAGRRKEG